MKIAQIAPLIESVPPPLYGGTERVVSYLTEELVRRKHEVTLFASGDSATAAQLVPVCNRALRLDPRVSNPLPHQVMMVQKVKEAASRFDVLHFHTDLVHFPVFSGARHATLTTLHGRQDLFDLRNFYAAFPDMPLVSISNAQRAPIADANFAGTVLHGLPEDLLPATYRPSGDYLAFVGRISPEKRVDRAIEIARGLGMPLRIAAKVDRVDEPYFREQIAPLLDGPGVNFIGEINERRKAQFLGNAGALLFPIDWPEPFGLVMIEAMACGTPLVAFDRGSVREVVDHGVTGFIVADVKEAIGAAKAALSLDRRRVRERFERRFTAALMTTAYEQLYGQVIAKRPKPRIVPISSRAQARHSAGDAPGAVKQ